MTAEEKNSWMGRLANENHARGVLKLLTDLLESAARGDVSDYQTSELTFDGLTKLRDLCREEPAYLRDAIVKVAMPACLRVSSELEMQFTLLSTREFIGKWLQELPDQWFVPIVEECYRLLVPALAGNTFEPANWTIAQIGYRSPRIVAALEALLENAARPKRLAIIGTLVSLGAVGDNKARYLDAALGEASEPLLSGSVSVLASLVDESSLDLLAQRFLNTSSPLPARTAESLVSILARIAAESTDPDHHDRIAKLLLRINDVAEKRIDGVLLMRGDVLPVINSPRVVGYLVEIIGATGEAADKTPGDLRLALLRLMACCLPEHLKGCEIVDSARVAPPLLTLLLSNDGHTGRDMTSLSDLKSHAVTGLLRLGRRELLQSFSDIIESEQSPYTAFEFIETMSIFEFDPLPPKISRFITEKTNLEKGQDAELILRLSASRLARSSASKDAFESLLQPGLLFAGSVMRDTVEALADVSLALAKEESKRTEITSRLVELLRHDVPEPQISSVCRALNILALSGYLSADCLPRLIQFLMEKPDELDAFDGGQIIHALGGFSRESIPVEMTERIKMWAQGKEDWLSWRSIEALINLELFDDNISWLAPRIGLTMEGDTWRWRDNETVSKWGSVFVVLLFAKHSARFARAVADVLQDRNWEASERATMTLAGVYQDRQPGEHVVIAAALVERVKLRNRPNSADLSVFGYLPVIAPSALATTNWSEMYPNWTASARAALADALQRLRLPAHVEAAELQLSRLAEDSHYGVRRSAIRSLSGIHRGAVASLNQKLATSSGIGDRVRAAEMLPYLDSDEAVTTRDLLRADAVKRVREAIKEGEAARQKAKLAHVYLERILAINNPSNDATLLIVKYVQALAEVGDDAVLNRLADDLASNVMPSRVRHLKAWLHKELGQEWEKRRRKWPEPMSQNRGITISGSGSLTVQDRVVPARYEIQFTPSEQTSDQFRWEGDVFVPKIEVNVELMNTDLWLTFEDGSRGQVHVGGTEISTALDDIKLTVSGLGAFPRAV